MKLKIEFGVLLIIVFAEALLLSWPFLERFAKR